MSSELVMNLYINDFEGPLDLLLHLVKTAKMDIYEIDTKKIIGEYLNFINKIDKKDLDNASEYLVMAAELIHLKSRLLVNSKDENDDNDYEINSEEDLKNKLIEYEKYKNICNEFRTFEENRKDFYTKIPENLSEFQEKKELSTDITIDDLVNAFINIKKREEYNKPINTRITKKELSVEDKTLFIKNKIKENKKILFEELFVNDSKEELIVTFLSILNLCKENIIILSQEKNFAGIYIEGNNNE